MPPQQGIIDAPQSLSLPGSPEGSHFAFANSNDGGIFVTQYMGAQPHNETVTSQSANIHDDATATTALKNASTPTGNPTDPGVKNDSNQVFTSINAMFLAPTQFLGLGAGCIREDWQRTFR